MRLKKKTRLKGDVSIVRRQDGNRYLIVGIDPGSTTGISALDLEGKPVFVESIKPSSKGKIIRKIYEHGKPVIIASDVSPAPKTLLKISSLLKVKLYIPPSDLSLKEKRSLLETYFKGVRLDDKHKKDASAAAAKAFKSYKETLVKVEKYAGNLVNASLLNEVKVKVISGVPVKSSLKEGFSGKERDQKREVKKQRTRMPREFSLIIDKLRELEREKELQIKALTEKIRSLEREIEYLKHRNKLKTPENKEVTLLKHRIRMLEQLHREIETKYKTLKEIRVKENYGKRFIPSISKLADIDKIRNLLGLRDKEVVHLKTKEKELTVKIIKELRKRRIGGFILENKGCLDKLFLENLRREGFLVIEYGKINVLEHLSEGILVDENSFFDIIKMEKERIKELKAEERKREIIGIIEDYRLKKVLK